MVSIALSNILYYLSNQYKIFSQLSITTMNILIKPNNFSKTHVLFLDTKPNMLFEGLFTKINYCDEFMIMYGIYIDIPIQQIDAGLKPIITNQTFEKFKSIETSIIDEYLEYRCSKERVATTKLTEYIQAKYDINDSCSGQSLAVLKISGIWENANNEVGLSFKIIKS